MSTARFFRALSAAGLSCLMLAGYAQAQQQANEHTKPTQYADQNTGQPLDAAQRPLNQTNPNQPGNLQDAAGGQRSTTYFRGPDAAGTGARDATASVDHYLANCLLIKNRGEIEINEFAQSRAQDDDVKKFAEEMVRDHQELGQKLQQVAQRDRGSNDAAIDRLLTIDRQISEKCGQMTRAKLEEAPDGEFDKCFVGQQIGAHVQMVAALEVISSEANGELKQVAEDAHKKVKKHLDHAEKLMKDLDSSDTRQARN